MMDNKEPVLILNVLLPSSSISLPLLQKLCCFFFFLLKDWAWLLPKSPQLPPRTLDLGLRVSRLSCEVFDTRCLRCELLRRVLSRRCRDATAAPNARNVQRKLGARLDDNRLPLLEIPKMGGREGRGGERKINTEPRKIVLTRAARTASCGGIL